MAEQAANPNASSLRGFGQWLQLWGGYMLEQARLMEAGLISEAELPLPPAIDADDVEHGDPLPPAHGQPPAHWLETAVSSGPPAHWLALFEDEQAEHADKPTMDPLSVPTTMQPKNSMTAKLQDAASIDSISQASANLSDTSTRPHTDNNTDIGSVLPTVPQQKIVRTAETAVTESSNSTDIEAVLPTVNLDASPPEDLMDTAVADTTAIVQRQAATATPQQKIVRTVETAVPEPSAVATQQKMVSPHVVETEVASQPFDHPDPVASVKYNQKQMHKSAQQIEQRQAATATPQQKIVQTAETAVAEPSAVATQQKMVSPRVVESEVVSQQFDHQDPTAAAKYNQEQTHRPAKQPDIQTELKPLPSTTKQPRVRLNLSPAPTTVRAQLTSNQNDINITPGDENAKAQANTQGPKQKEATARRVTRLNLTQWSKKPTKTTPMSKTKVALTHKTAVTQPTAEVETAVTHATLQPKDVVPQQDVPTIAKRHNPSPKATVVQWSTPAPNQNPETENLTPLVESKRQESKQRPLTPQEGVDEIKWSSSKPKPWPKLPDPPPLTNSKNETRTDKRQQARIERLRREQRGGLWNE